MVLAPRCWRQVARKYSRGDGGKRAGHRGEYEVSRKPLRRESRVVSGSPVVLLPCFFCTGPMGAIGTRLSLRPLLIERVKCFANLGRNMPREREVVSQPSSSALCAIAHWGGRSSIPEALVIEPKSRSVLDTPPEPVIGRRFGRSLGGV